MPSELRLNRTLYDRQAVDAATSQFADFAEISLSEDKDHFVVTIEHADGDRSRLIADELGNMALGLTIESGGLTG